MDNEKLNNTIRIVKKVLEENKENPKAVEAYKDIVELANKRNIEE